MANRTTIWMKTFALLMAAGMLPCLAVNSNRAAKVEAERAQAAMHRRLREKAHKPAPQAGPWLPNVARLGPCLKPALVGLLLASQGAAGAGAQPLMPSNPLGLLQNLNLSAPDATSVFTAQGVNVALARANTSGALPSLDALNTLLEGNHPSGGSVLQTLTLDPGATLTLPEVEPGTSAATDDQPQSGDIGRTNLPSFLLNQPSDVPNTQSAAALAAAQANLDVAQLTNVFYLLEAIGNQLIGDAALVVVDAPRVASALEFAGFQLASIGFFFAEAASQRTTGAAQTALAYLQPQPPAPPAQGTLTPVLNPELIYGTWERLNNDRSPQTILYKVSRTEVVKINATVVGEGQEDIETEVHPGAVSGYLSYRRPTGSGTLGQVLGDIQVRVVIDKADGTSLALKFVYLRATGDSEQDLDVLVEQQGEKKAYVKISEY